MQYWLLKTEPDEFSIQDLANQKKAVWDGVRNYAARNALRDHVGLGDKAFIYHSSCKKVGIAGVASIVKAGYPDPAQFDQTSTYFDPKATLEQPRWYCVDVGFERAFEQVLPLADIKRCTELANMTLLKQPRLSVQSVTEEEFQFILSMSR